MEAYGDGLGMDGMAGDDTSMAGAIAFVIVEKVARQTERSITRRGTGDDSILRECSRN
jgi:hypothetical protein